jgi:hypothetical protein
MADERDVLRRVREPIERVVSSHTDDRGRHEVDRSVDPRQTVRLDGHPIALADRLVGVSWLLPCHAKV